MDDKFSKEIEVSRLASENASNLIYVKIDGGDTNIQIKQKANHASTQLERGGMSLPWNEQKGDELMETLMSQGEIDILLDDGENPDKPKHDAVMVDLEDSKLREELENMKHVMEPEPEKLTIESENDNSSPKDQKSEPDDEYDVAGKRSTEEEDMGATITEIHLESEPVTEKEDGEVCTEVEDKRNRKMTAKAMAYQEAVKNKGKLQLEVKDNKPKVDEIPPECKKCNQYTENGVFCVACQRWYHFTCVPEAQDEILLVADYVCQEHEGIGGKQKAIDKQRKTESNQTNTQDGKKKTEVKCKQRNNDAEMHRVKDEKQQLLNQLKQSKENMDNMKQEKEDEIRNLKMQTETSKKEYTKLLKQNATLTKEKEQATERVEEAEKMHEESKTIIDEKEDKIRETEEDVM